MSDLSYAVIYAVLGALLGIAIMLLVSCLVPKLVSRFTPRIDEEKELVRGNRAVADYYSRVVAAVIIGISIIIAAAVLAGMHG